MQIKTTIGLIAGLFMAFSALSQGHIDNIYFQPSQPAPGDTVCIIADLSFSSSGCPLDNQFATVQGTNIIASAHHCLGVLTAICNTSDTFKIVLDSAWNYTFTLTLTSGGLPAPCTPGIVPDDTLSIVIPVSNGSPTGIEENHNLIWTVYPNPSTGAITISAADIEPGSSLLIRDIQGRLIEQHSLTVSATVRLSSGTYLLQIDTPRGLTPTKRVIITE